ncbi:uncharacterized protein T551_02949, partial [Pneumocystis jirovecii RU7]
MKVFMLIVSLGISYVFSENIEFIYKKSILSDLISEEKFFALILKENALNDQCQIKLKEYCKNLEDMNLNPKNLHYLLKKPCEEMKIKETCDNLKSKIKQTCTTYEKVFESIIKESFLRQQSCLLEDNCMFLEGACPMEFRQKCNKLRERCRKKKQNEITEKILLRILSKNLKNKETCEKVINEKCLLLVEESNELMEFCLNSSDRCQKLINMMNTQCSNLESDISFLFTHNDTLKTQCSSLLEKCYFYEANCDDNIQTNCEKLKKKCEKQTKYTLLNLTFNPIKNIALMEKIGKEELFGDEIRKPKIKDTIDLLILITNSSLKECKTRLNKCYEFCNLLPQLKYLYDNITKEMSKNKEEICTTLKSKLKLRCNAFKLKLADLSLSNTTKDYEEAALLGWFEQFTTLDDRLCANLESRCFYLQKPCNSENIKLDNACSNAKLACLKMRVFRKEYQLLETNLRGKLHNLTIKSSLKTCVNELFNLCKKETNIKKPVLINLCLQPWDTCKELANDIEKQSKRLRNDLDQKRDFPDKEDCKKLKEKCEVLGHDSKTNDLPCFTLKGRCDHLENAKELEEILLEEKVENLGNLDICIKKVSEKCNKWSKKKRTRFIFSCIQLVTTCQIITRDIKSKCSVLERNIDIEDVLDQVKSDDADIKGPTCDLWEPYCDKFMLSCEKLVRNNGKNGKCKELKESCEPYRRIQEQEMKLMYELRGGLNSENKCKSTLNEHCLHWDKTKNDTFKNFCNNNTDTKNNTTKNELCKKLLKHVKERCTKLLAKLNGMATEIEENVKIVEKLNEAAKKALKNTNLILTSSKQKTDPNINNATLILAYN